MTRRRLWARAVVASALVVACGGETDDGGGSGGGGSGGGGAGAGGTTGGVGGTTTGGSGGTIAGGSGGVGGVPAQCDALQQQYQSYLGMAKLCNSLINSIQCTEAINDDLACPCTTYVNPGNSEALKKLKELQAAWTAQDCSKGIMCPAVACIAPQGAGCVVNGAGGDADGCKDFGPD